MKIEEQVLSIEQMNHLKEVGLKVEDTALSWADLSEPGKFSVSPNYENAREILRKGCVIIPTLTLQEILELLPSCINVDGEDYLLDVDCDCIYETSYYSYNKNGVRVLASEFLDEKSLNSTYRMLCWVIENGYLKSEQ